MNSRSHPLLEFRNVRKTYGESASEVRALDDVSFSIAEREFVSVIGQSGSGKSTCLNILGGLDTPTSGSYLFQGDDVGQLTLKQRARLRRSHIGFVFQSFNLLGRTTALENVELPLIYQRITAGERRRRALAALDRVGLSERVGHTPAELSGGQKQRVAIARALVGEPDLLLADEPTGNLDSTSSDDVMAFLTELNSSQNLTVVLVTHEPELASLAPRTFQFRDGRMEESGSPVAAATLAEHRGETS